MEARRKDIVERAKLVVIKIGTNVLTDEGGSFDRRTISHLAEEIARLKDKGLRIIIVSSGAIGAGMADLGMTSRPETLPELQAAGAVGQSSLMRMYNEVFTRHGFRSAQMLLTWDDFDSRKRYLNVRNTITTLLGLPTIPVINENDSVSTDEIRFGDNDILSAMVTNLVNADILIMLTSVDGLMRLDGQGHEAGGPIDYVESITDELLGHVSGEKTLLGTGGMEAKLKAVDTAMKGGAAIIIANGKKPNTLARVFSGEAVGTLFLPGEKALAGRKKWIRFSTKVKGRISVDAGAARALKEQGKSLLSSGITDVSGAFSEGDTVAVCDEAGAEFARGLVNYSSQEVKKIKGQRTDRIASILGSKPFDEVVHRDNMALT
jgi:glutamate 5-kinase